MAWLTISTCYVSNWIDKILLFITSARKHLIMTSLLTRCLTTLTLSLALCTTMQAQTTTTDSHEGIANIDSVSAASIPADSVRLIALPETGEVGFIIPKSVALHYRNLVFDLLPALEQKIQLLEDASAQQLSLSENRLQQIGTLKEQRDNLQEQITLYAADATALQVQLEEVNKSRKREIRMKKFWRSTNYVFMGTTAILSVLLLAK